MKHLVHGVAVAIAAASFALPVSAQPPAKPQEPTLPPAAVPTPEAAALAQGWVLLAEGKYDEASRAARTISSRFPRSAAALALVVETDIAHRGATTALDSYEAWVGKRPHEEPAALRRIARAFLYEWGRQTRDGASRSDALVALAEDGEPDALALIAAGGAGVNVRARLGDQQAIDTLVARVHAAPGPKVGEIQVLAETGNRRAAPGLLAVLNDPMAENKAAAAAALGKLGYHEAAPALRELLQDPRGSVRVAAAGALFQLGDTSGVSVLEELAASEHATIRRSAALLMASQPTEAWKGLVRGLATDEDAAIRLDAARLIAPHDPELARSLFDRLMADSNPAVQEQAALALAESPVSSLAELRAQLRSGAGLVKVRAAARILGLTR
jgi:HEAT repeat protein